MFSLKYIRENLDLIQKSIKAKNVIFDLDELILLDDKRRKIIACVEKLKAERNVLNKKISLKKDIEENINSMRTISVDIKEYDAELNNIIKEINNKILYIPNIIHDSVPICKY